MAVENHHCGPSRALRVQGDVWEDTAREREQAQTDAGWEVSLRLDSGLVVLIDPLALDGLRDLFTHEFAVRLAADPSLVRTVPGFLRVGIHCVNPFVPGSHRVSRLGIEQVDDASSEEDDRIFDIDTGSVVLVDVHHLASVANALTWERYDWALQAPLDDTSRWTAIAREDGGDVFGILDAESDSPFPGDGRYCLDQEIEHQDIAFGDTVRVKATPETEAAGLAEQLLEFVDHNPGAELRLDGVAGQWVRDADGKWELTADVPDAPEARPGLLGRLLKRVTG